MISGSHWTSTNVARDTISPIFAEEVSKFEQGLERGRKEYAKLISQRQGLLNEQDTEYLASTFGYPRVLIELEENQRKEAIS
jgi:alanyl-tRNA synthetase